MTDQHLDDEALSAALDGEPAPHLDGCAACEARLARLRAAAEAIAAPLPVVDPGVRNAAIARALDGRVVPLRRRPATWVLGAAAALVAALAVGLVVSRGPDHDQSDTLATKQATPGAAGGSAASAAAAGPTALGDLGPIDATTVDAAVRARLTEPQPQDGGSLAAPCQPGLDTYGAPVAYGTGTVQRTAAVVLVFSSASGGRRIVVVAAGDCDRILLATSSQP